MEKENLFARYVHNIVDRTKQREHMLVQREIQTDACLLAIKRTIKEIQKKRMELGLENSPNTTNQLNALRRYILDLDLIFDGLEKSCCDTIRIREQL